MTKKISLLWFFIHFSLEVVCFQFYGLFFGRLETAAVMALIYDGLAFFPQFFIGKTAEEIPKMRVGLIGAVMVLLGGSTAFFGFEILRFFGFLVLSLGNAFVHVGGAKATLYTCGKKITPCSVFISGGAFGVITGKLLGASGMPFVIGFFIMLAALLLIMLADSLFERADKSLPVMDMADKRKNAAVIVMLAFFTVSVRGLLGYGIPMAWNNTSFHNFCLFCMMGVGKTLGGICSDNFGAKKTALISTGVSLPLLLAGSENMWLSLIGTALFSMTMASTLGILVSAVPKHPLMAYGLSVTGLLAGTLPAFFPQVLKFVSQSVFLAVLTAFCFAALYYIMRSDKEVTIRKDEKNERIA